MVFNFKIDQILCAILLLPYIFITFDNGKKKLKGKKRKEKKCTPYQLELSCTSQWKCGFGVSVLQSKNMLVQLTADSKLTIGLLTTLNALQATFMQHAQSTEICTDFFSVASKCFSIIHI